MKISSVILMVLSLSVGISETALGGVLLVANPNDITITQVDLTTGVSSVLLSASDGLTRPTELTLDASGNLYFTNVGSYDIYRYSTTGVLTKYYDSLGASLPASIHGIDFDRNGILYVGFSDGRIEKYNEGTGSLESFATAGRIGAIEFDTSGNLYVADSNFSTGNGRIQKVDSSGNVSIFATGLANPRDLNIDSSNQLYVAHRIWKPGVDFFDLPSNTKNTLASLPSGNVRGVETDSLGNVYVLHANGDIRYWDSSGSGGAVSFNSGSTFSEQMVYSPNAFPLSSSTVPEPSTAIAMGLLSVLGFAGNRRRSSASV